MTERVEIETRGGGKASGDLALPGAATAPAVVVLQEWWGVNDHIRSLVDRLARAGFVALAPDLYHGKTTRDEEEAGRMMASLDWPRALDEIAGAVALLAAHPRVNGEVGVVGFCMGGALALATAATVPAVAAAVSFYGVPDRSKFDLAKIRAPVLAHVARRDRWVTPEIAAEVKRTVESSGGSMRLELYDADHAFANDTRPEVYAPDSAKLAWERTVEFLREQLA